MKKKENSSVNNKKNIGNKGRSTRTIIFFIIVAIIVVTTIIIIVVKINNKNSNIQLTDDPTQGLSLNNVNENATPESMPSIGGEDNIKIQDGVKVNKSEKILSEKKFDIYTMTNINLEATSSGTTLTASVSATSEEKISGRDITIKFYDNTVKFVSMMNSYIGQIRPGETIDFRAESTSDLSNAYDMEIILK